MTSLLSSSERSGERFDLAVVGPRRITEVTLAIRAGPTIEDITTAFHPYLTLSEGVKLAAQAFPTDVAKLSCCAA